MKIIDLFCGIGGLSLGFEQAGFEVVSAIDMWKDAIVTYNHNRKDKVAKVETVEDFNIKELPEIKNVYYVDKRVLSEYEGEVFVYKEGEDGIFQSVKVTIGQVIGNNVIILNGLEEGDTVSIP